MIDPGHLQRPEQNVVEHKVRRAVGISALRKIGMIVAREQQLDADKANILRWLARHAWLVFIGIALLTAYLTGMI